MGGEPSFTELLKMAVKDGTARIHTACPAIVTAYDSTRQTVEARLVIRSRFRGADGTVQSVKGPVLTNIPVLFPHSASGFGLTFPLAKGDWVLLHIAERSLDEWKASGNDDITAGDLRRFDLSDAYAYPGGQPPAVAVGSSGVSATAMVVEGSDIRLGSSAAADKVALSTATDSAINAISTLLKTWVVAPGDGGAALKALAISTLGTASTGATKVSAE